MTFPNNKFFIDFLKNNLGASVLQKLYIDFTLSPNAFKLNQETKIDIKQTKLIQTKILNKFTIQI
jgi:hypothetical protein